MFNIKISLYQTPPHQRSKYFRFIRTRSTRPIDAKLWKKLCLWIMFDIKIFHYQTLPYQRFKIFQIFWNVLYKAFRYILNILILWYGSVWQWDILISNIIQRHNFFESFASIGRVDLVYHACDTFISNGMIIKGRYQI